MHLGCRPAEMQLLGHRGIAAAISSSLSLAWHIMTQSVILERQT
jgi:hypothetical protein